MRRIWAIARQTLLECLRTRVFGVFVILMAVCVLGIALTFEGDGTLRGRIQTFLSYSLLLTELLLGLITVFLSTGLVANDIRHKYIFAVATKPVARWQYVLGRWLGVLLLDVLLLALSMASIYALAQYLRGQQTQAERQQAMGLPPAEQLLAQVVPVELTTQAVEPPPLDVDRLEVETRVFTARDTRGMDPVDVERLVRERLKELADQQGMDNLLRNSVRRKLEHDAASLRQTVTPDDAAIDGALRDPTFRRQALSELEDGIRQGMIEQHNLVQPGAELRIAFSDIRLIPGSPEKLELRYRLYPLTTPRSAKLTTLLVFENPGNGRQFLLARTDSTELAGSAMIPPEAVSGDGRLVVRYLNQTQVQGSEQTAVKIKADEFTLMYRAGSFGGNLCRAGGLVLLRLAFLGGVGVLFAVFLSFPVACLVCLILFAIGAGSGFIQDSLRTYDEGGWFRSFSAALTRVVFLVLPEFGRTSVADSMVDGANIPPAALGRELLTGSGLRALAALGVGCLIFRRRELARVQV